MSTIVSTDTDATTPWVNAADDALLMLASLQALNDTRDGDAGDLSSGLTLERRINALSNISRLLIQSIQNETGATEDQVFSGIRRALILQADTL